MPSSSSSADAPDGLRLVLTLNPDSSCPGWLRASRPADATPVEIEARLVRTLLVLHDARKVGTSGPAHGWLHNETIGRRIERKKGALGPVARESASKYVSLLNKASRRALAGVVGRQFQPIVRKQGHGARLNLDVVIEYGPARDEPPPDDSADAVAALTAAY